MEYRSATLESVTSGREQSFKRAGDPRGVQTYYNPLARLFACEGGRGERGCHRESAEVGVKLEQSYTICVRVCPEIKYIRENGQRPLRQERSLWVWIWVGESPEF